MAERYANCGDDGSGGWNRRWWVLRRELEGWEMMVEVDGAEIGQRCFVICWGDAVFEVDTVAVLVLFLFRRRFQIMGWYLFG